MAFREGCSPWERWLLQYGEWLNTGILVAVPSVLSPKPPTPNSPPATLVHSALPLPEPRVSGCKWNFVNCIKRLSASPDVSPWQIETLLLFTAGCYLGSFQAWYCRLGSPAWGIDPTLLRGNPHGHWIIPSGLQLPHVGAQPALWHLLHTPYQSHCGDVASSTCVGL